MPYSDEAPASFRQLATDAARGVGVVAGGTIAGTAAEATRAAGLAAGKAGLAKAGIATAAGAKATAAGVGGAKLGVFALVASPAAAVILPIGAAIAAGWIVRRALSRPDP